MALFKILKGNEAALPTNKIEGYAYFCKDTGAFFVDINNSERKQLTCSALSYDGNIKNFNDIATSTDINAVKVQMFKITVPSSVWSQNPTEATWSSETLNSLRCTVSPLIISDPSMTEEGKTLYDNISNISVTPAVSNGANGSLTITLSSNVNKVDLKLIILDFG